MPSYNFLKLSVTVKPDRQTDGHVETIWVHRQKKGASNRDKCWKLNLNLEAHGLVMMKLMMMSLYIHVNSLTTGLELMRDRLKNEDLKKYRFKNTKGTGN